MECMSLVAAGSVECMSRQCGVYVEAVWSVCQGSVECMSRQCGVYVEAVWSVCRGSVECMSRQCGVVTQRQSSKALEVEDRLRQLSQLVPSVHPLVSTMGMAKSCGRWRVRWRVRERKERWRERGGGRGGGEMEGWRGKEERGEWEGEGWGWGWGERENQRMSQRNLCLEFLWLDHNNKYK